MSKKIVDPKDDYSSSIKDKKDKEIILGSPSFISKVTCAITDTLVTTIKPTLLNLVAFISQIISPLSIKKTIPLN